MKTKDWINMPSFDANLNLKKMLFNLHKHVMWFVATKSLMTCEEIKLHACMSWMSGLP